MQGRSDTKSRRVSKEGAWGYVCRGFIIALLLSLSACASTGEQEKTEESYQQANVLPAEEATVVAYKEQEFDDPLMGFNRAIFGFNDVTYRYLMIPVSNAYQGYVPAPVRTGVGNVFANIKSPISIINHLLQGEASKAGTTTLRFLVNTTLGIAGIFDPAEGWWDIKEETTGFKDTLTDYGSGSGVYIVLPFLGPADLRSGTGLVADYFLNPIPYLTEQPDTTIIMATDAMQGFSGKANTYKTLREKSDDPYIFFRNLYLQGQLRDKQFPKQAQPADDAEE